ncbi:hepatocyte growth factor-regulated tyrosine kinase substrate isoform X2 [Plodia interpunctella]|uniref:hepatocyte growth factor-regulated tyrosine kinase substrate isoform X2 n=1 Tax=Plodia interpunctella TaxID=58824 RepID=UPI0023684079|nr:hepatocyte growth factor-regulated tyrosine kinase substrate isoform X2 [Plodia interpunctella]
MKTLSSRRDTSRLVIRQSMTHSHTTSLAKYKRLCYCRLRKNRELEILTMDTVNILKAEGFKFPTLKESDAMFSADTAPEWADGEVCHRCRTAFTLMVRRHHCRACGQVFCQQCSSKTSTLPKFGIEKEVRVCDACYDKVSRPPSSSAKLEIIDTSSDYGPTQPQKRPPGSKTEEELREEEELQLALALSQSEAEHKEKERKSRSHIAPEPAHHPTLSPSPSSVSASPDHSVQASSELSRYLDRNYWEQRLSRDSAAPAAPTAPAPSSIASQDNDSDYTKPNSKTVEEDAEDKEIDEFVETLKSQIEIFVNRMKSNSSRGRSIANDTSVQTLFMNITAMHSRLLRYIQQQDDKRVYLESLQDKVTQVRDSRAALDTLRAEHAARLAAQAEAVDRQRQMQMAAKLQAMRKKKHEYLQYQRQLALQRVQEQEREMQMRQEQQKHQYMMSANTGYYMPGVTMPQYQPNYPNPMYANPQFHQMMPQSTTDGSITLPGQPQMSQANMPINVNQLGQMSQSIPQMTNTFAMTTSGMAISQAPGVQTMNQGNIRPNQSIPLQQQMLMQQMHQMRMPVQTGVHQIMSQNMPNGLAGQNLAQQNGQTNLLKQNQSMVPSIPGQHNLNQQMMNPSNPLLMQMQNLRMSMMQGNQSNPSQQMQGYPGMQQPSQLMPGQIPAQAQSMTLPTHIPSTNQNVPQGQVPVSHNQQMPQQQAQMAQQMAMPGQSMQPPGQMIPGQQPPGQMMPNQQMVQSQNIQQNQMGQMPQPPNQIPGQQGQVPHQMQAVPPQAAQVHAQISQGHNLPQGQQMPQGPPMPQGQPMPQNQQMAQGQPMPQGQPIPQGQQIPQGQPMPQGQIPPGQQLAQGNMVQGQQPQGLSGAPKLQPSQGFINGVPGAQPSPSQQQQPQTPVKSEHNNNTAELISFD